MWAVIDKKTQIVLGVIPPDINIEKVNQAKIVYDLVLMTPDNSPATIGDKYENGKFINTEGEK